MLSSRGPASLIFVVVAVSPLLRSKMCLRNLSLEGTQDYRKEGKSPLSANYEVHGWTLGHSATVETGPLLRHPSLGSRGRPRYYISQRASGPSPSLRHGSGAVPA